MQRVRIKLYLFEVLCPGPWTSGLVSHTSLSEFSVTHPSLFSISGETDEYMIFGRIGATGLFIQIFIWDLGECNWVYGLLLYEILLVARCSPDWR